MTHWLQGVPPGSKEQLPPSIGGIPQLPPLQVSPMQHCDDTLQDDPIGRHAPEPQTPMVHIPEQHSSGAPHGKPSTLH